MEFFRCDADGANEITRINERSATDGARIDSLRLPPGESVSKGWVVSTIARSTRDRDPSACGYRRLTSAAPGMF